MGPTQTHPHFRILLKVDTCPRQVLVRDSSPQLKNVLFPFPLCTRTIRSIPKPYQRQEKYSHICLGGKEKQKRPYQI